MKKHLRSAFLASLTALFVIASVATAEAFDANADFTASSPNPNGVWTYGYTPTLGGAFTQHGEFASSSQGFAWRTNLSAGAPAFNKFTSDGFGANAGETSLHGGPNGEHAVLRFTVPAPGLYDVLATWRGPGDSGDTDLYLLRNSNAGSPLGSTANTNTSGSFQVNSLALTAGETIDLSLGTLGSFISDNTPVNLVVTLVPEPSSLLLACAGSCLACHAGRRRMVSRRQ